MIKKGNLLQFEGLNAYDGLIHFTTTRHGGVSCDRYATLNGSPFCGDRFEHVSTNQRQILNHFSGDSLSLVLPFQVHDDVIKELDDYFFSLSDHEQKDFLEGVDGLITRCSNICVAVSTADCVPILLFDPLTRGVGAVHAGWRGTVKCISQKSVLSMVRQWGSDPSEIRVAIAPSISLDSFEVGDEVYRAFLEKGFPMERISRRDATTGKWHIDLWEANVWQLEAVGVDRKHIEISQICTFRECDNFFSARRLTIRSGRNLTGIGLVECSVF